MLIFDEITINVSELNFFSFFHNEYYKKMSSKELFEQYVYYYPLDFVEDYISFLKERLIISLVEELSGTTKRDNQRIRKRCGYLFFSQKVKHLEWSQLSIEQIETENCYILSTNNSETPYFLRVNFTFDRDIDVDIEFKSIINDELGIFLNNLGSQFSVEPYLEISDYDDDEFNYANTGKKGDDYVLSSDKDMQQAEFYFVGYFYGWVEEILEDHLEDEDELEVQLQYINGIVKALYGPKWREILDVCKQCGSLDARLSDMVDEFIEYN